MSAMDPAGVQLRRLAQKSGDELLRQYDWMLLRKEQTVTLVDGTASYEVAADWARLIPGTWWDRTQQWALIGPMTPQEWQYRKSGIVTVGPRRRFRMMPSTAVVPPTKRMFLDPTPGADDAGATIVYEYISNRWIASNGVAVSQWALDADTSLIDEDCITAEIIWRYKRARGLEYADEQAEAKALCAARFAHDVSSNYVPLGSRRAVEWPPYPTVPDSGYGQ